MNEGRGGGGIETVTVGWVRLVSPISADPTVLGQVRRFLM